LAQSTKLSQLLLSQVFRFPQSFEALALRFIHLFEYITVVNHFGGLYNNTKVI